MTEIELKAHVADPAETERIIRSFASFGRHVQKSDAYWKRENTESEPKAESAPNGLKVRIREESFEEGSSSTLVTYKRKELRGDIEVNDEREFSIDDRAAFESLIEDLGFTAYIRKEKDTKSFAYRAPGGHDMTIELSLVAGLGWFIEIEILADSPTAEETELAQHTLRETLARCGIPESAIERRYYTEMLEESDGASAGTDASTSRSFRPKK